MRDLLRSRPSAEALGEIDAMAGVDHVVASYWQAMSVYDAERVTAEVLHELLRWRYAGSSDYWRAL